MVNIRTVAASVGMVAGGWTLLGSYFGGIGRACGGQALCVPTPPPNLYVVGIAALLLLNSVVCMLGPSKLFYASAGLAILLAGSVFLQSALSDTTVLTALGLATLTAVLSLVAATRRTEVSEQANPMNLPVFG